MWIHAGFSPDTFWDQTPRHFQLAMRGVRKRLEAEYEARLSQAHDTAAFFLLAQNNKLKAKSHYLPKPERQQATTADILNYFKAAGKNSNMKIRTIKP